MGSMTSGLVIPPNTIDFDEVFNDIGAKTRENPYVLIVVCLLAGLYLILLIPIRRMDVKDYRLVRILSAQTISIFVKLWNNTDFYLHRHRPVILFKSAKIWNHIPTCGARTTLQF